MSYPTENLFSLKDKVVLVTGGSRGIGLAAGHIAAAAGAQVILSSRKQENLEKAAESVQKAGFSATTAVCNMSDIGEIDRLVSEIVEKFGQIDILINNAAANPVFGPLHETSLPAFDKIIDVNLKGPFHLANRVFEKMKESGGGNIINISSIGGLSPEKHLGIYSVSKAALLMLTKVQAQEWGPSGVRVNAICPGLIKTEFSRPLWDNEKMLKYFLRTVPLGRVGVPEEIAGLILFLASDASSYITGSTFTADGGFSI